MKVTLYSISWLASLACIFSFMFLVVAICTDFWKVVDASKLAAQSNLTNSFSSHSGLWRRCQLKATCTPLANPFQPGTTNMTSSHKRILTMQRASLILLPLSLILMVFGGMSGFMSLLSQAYALLLLTGLQFLLGALITLAGISVYIAFSTEAFKESISLLRNDSLKEMVSVRFSWSLAFAWLSFTSETLAGLGFLWAARMVALKRRQNHRL